MLNNYFFHEGYFFKEFSQKGFLLFFVQFSKWIVQIHFFQKRKEKTFLFSCGDFIFFSLCQMRIFFSWKKFFFFSSHFWIFSDAQFLVCSFFEHKFIGVQRRLQPPPSLHHRPWRYCHLWPQQLAHRRADRLRLRGRACCASARNQWPLGKWALSTALRCARARLHCGPRLQEGAAK